MSHSRLKTAAQSCLCLGGTDLNPLCRATSFSVAQEVLRPPTFVQKMLNSRALEGDTVRLECKVDASPPPQLFWKKDKDMLRIDPNRMRLVDFVAPKTSVTDLLHS